MDRIYYCENPDCTHQAEHQATICGDHINVCGPCLTALQWANERVPGPLVAIPLCDVEEVYCDSCTKFGCRTCGCQHPDAAICDEFELKGEGEQ